MSGLLPSADDERRVRDLLIAYSRCLDADDLEKWPGFFTPDGLYKVLSRENLTLGLPAPIIYHYSRAMMEDRVTAIRDALTYEPVYTRHMTSGLQVAVEPEGGFRALSDFAIYQSTEEGVTRLFCVGEYRDRIVVTREGLRFAERLVVLDSFAVQNLIAVPL